MSIESYKNNSGHDYSRYRHQAEEAHLADRYAAAGLETAHPIFSRSSAGHETVSASDYGRGLLSNPALHGRGNNTVRIALMQHAQRTSGNRAVQRFLHDKQQDKSIHQAPHVQPLPSVDAEQGGYNQRPVPEKYEAGTDSSLPTLPSAFLAPTSLPFSLSTSRASPGTMFVQRMLGVKDTHSGTGSSRTLKRDRGSDDEDEDQRKNKKQALEQLEQPAEEKEEEDPAEAEYDADSEWEKIKDAPQGTFAEGRDTEDRTIDYLTGKESRHSRRMRRRYAKKGTPIAHSRNLMTVTTRSPKGRKNVITRASEQQGGRHSEPVIRDTLQQDERFRGHTVIGKPYSERAGCGIGPGFQNCRGTAIPSITGSSEHLSTIDHPDQRDFMEQGTLDEWNGGQFQRGMTSSEKEKIREKAKEAKKQAEKSRDKLGDYLSRQFSIAEEESSTSGTETNESYDEWTDSDFGVNPTSGKPGTQRNPKRDSDDDDYIDV